VFPIEVPPLRERREDIPMLSWTFVKEFSNSMGKPIDEIADESMSALQEHPWPGNVLELRNVIERAMILSHGPTLHIKLGHTTFRPTTTKATAGSLEEAERHHSAGGRIGVFGDRTARQRCPTSSPRHLNHASRNSGLYKSSDLRKYRWRLIF
jgi:DNA-binding NtrC family response regulator